MLEDSGSSIAASTSCASKRAAADDGRVDRRRGSCAAGQMRRLRELAASPRRVAAVREAWRRLLPPEAERRAAR